MYPTLYHLVYDLFGIQIPMFKLVQSFGMMVALAFVAASTVLATELKRKEGAGLIGTTTRKVWKGNPSTFVDKITSAVIGFLIGFKLFEMILNPSLLDDTQALFLSLDGNVLGGLLVGAAFLGFRFYDDKKNTLPEPVEIIETIHPADHAGSITIIAAVVGILGAKIFHNLENLDTFFNDPVGSLLSFSGLTFYGGLICATVAIIIYTKKHNIKFVHLVDSAAPGLILAYGVGRIGCHLAGDGDWGISNTSAMPKWLAFMPEWIWAYDYPNNVLSEGVRLTEGVIYPGYGYHLVPSVFPTAIYEVMMSLVIFTFLWGMRKRWSTPGMITAVYLIFNGTERFLIEKIRVNNVFDLMGLSVTQAEVISFGIFFMGVVGIFLSKKYGEKWAE